MQPFLQWEDGNMRTRMGVKRREGIQAMLGGKTKGNMIGYMWGGAEGEG